MTDSDKLIDLLRQRVRLTAMVAPSFPIMYDPKEIVSKLKSIGFSYVVEVAVGAKNTNRGVYTRLKTDPGSRFITSPCPSFVRMVRTKHPDLLKYLALDVDSPMTATAKIAKQKYPDAKVVFIGPCLVKKLEASQDHPELDILVLTYRELEDVFNKLLPAPYTPLPNYNDTFDLFESSTRTYPIDGGLAATSGAKTLLKDEELRTVSGYKNCESALVEFAQNKKIRLLDILFCDGGCIMGPGINSNLNLEQRKKKIFDYAR